MNLNREYSRAIQALEAGADAYRAYVVRDENSKWFDSTMTYTMLPEFGRDSFRISSALLLYVCHDSRYFHSEELLDMLLEGCRGAEKKILEDGTVHLYISNFYTPETFALASIARDFETFSSLVDKEGTNSEKEKEARAAVLHVIKRLSTGCLNGGFHTPNHRWVESSAMLMSYNILGHEGNEALLEKAEKYMAEGIDCDETGEFSERSVGMYNLVCDRAYINIARETGNRDFLSAVCRNLELVQYYINNDYSLFTQNSRRKDKGEVGSVPLFYKATTYYAYSYAELYLEVGYLTNNMRFISIADELVRAAENAGKSCGIPLELFLRYPELRSWNPDTQGEKRPTEYELYQPKSNIVRKVKDGVGYSFFSKNPSFLQMRFKDIRISVRMCSSFFAVAQFNPDTLEKTENGYRMTMVSEACYKLPLDNPDESTKNYWSIDYSKRKSVHAMEYTTSVEAVFTDKGVALNIKTDGCADVPFKLEISVSAGLHAESGNVIMETSAGGSAYVRGGDMRFESVGGAVMNIEGLFCRHLYANDMRGSLDPMEGAFTLYATDFSPVNRTVTFSFDDVTEARSFYD